MRIVFMGSPIEVVMPLRHLHVEGKQYGLQLVGIVSQPARPVGRSNHLQDPPVAQWAKSEGIPCLQPESARASDFLETLRTWNPDVIVTAAYGQILTDEFLNIPTRATINIHPSALPKYRGATPVPAALLDGLPETAVTILFTVKKLDAGNIILQKVFRVEGDEKSGDLTARLFEASGPLLIDALQAINDKKFVGIPQNHTEATFCKKIDKEAGLVDWNQSTVTVVNRFRAFEPWPGSWTYFAGRRISLTAMSVDSAIVSTQIPGSVSFDKPSKSLLVSTANGLVKITELKPAGGKTMDAASFWNGLKDKTNVVFRNAEKL